MPPSQDRAILIIGNGPSARELIERGLENLPEGLDTFGMGAAYRYYHSLKWWPTYYALADTKVVYSHRGELANLITDPSVTTQRFFFPLPLVDSPRLTVIPHSPTGDFCFREAIRMGYKTIYLIGIEGAYVEEIPECRSVSDTNFKKWGFDKLGLSRSSRENLRVITKSPVAHANYFFDWYQTKGDVYSLPRGDIHRRKWTEVAAEAEAAGAKVFNLSPISTITEFPRANLADLMPQRRRSGSLKRGFAARAQRRNLAIFYPTLRTPEERTFWRAFVDRVKARGYDPIVVLMRKPETIDAETVLGEGVRVIQLPMTLFTLGQHPDFTAFGPNAPRQEPRLPQAMEEHYVESEFIQEICRDRAVHHGLHRLLRESVITYTNWVSRFLREARVAKVIVNNDTQMRALAVRTIAEAAGIEVMHSERSPFTTQWFDQGGFYARTEAKALLADGAWEQPGPHEAVGRELVRQLREDPAGHRSRELRKDLRTAATSAANGPDGRRLKFLLPMDAVMNTGWAPRGHPLQPVNYPLFRSPIEAIRALAEVAKRFDATLVIKRHPSDRYLSMLSLPEGVEVYDGPLERALGEADLVFCFLTKVAFAALAMERPVVTLSPGIPALSGLTAHCATLEDIPAQVEAALATTPSDARRTRLARFLGYLHRHFFVDLTLDNPGAERLLSTHFPALPAETPRDGELDARLAPLDVLKGEDAGGDPNCIYGPFARDRGRRIEEVDIVFGLFDGGVLPASRQPVMVDVGACKGAAFAKFAQRGWTIHAFEPNPPMYDLIREKLAAEPPAGRVVLDQRAVSEKSGEELPFYTSEESLGISSLSPFRDSHKPTAIVHTIRLDEYCRREGVRNIDFLKVDTEGFDLFVLKGYDWRRSKPRVIVCEFENAKTERLGYTVDDTIAFLQQRGYTVYISEWHPITRYGGGEHRWRQMLKAPSDRLSPESWGNLIAFRDPIDETAFRQRVVHVAERMSQWFQEVLSRRAVREEAARLAKAADEARINAFLAELKASRPKPAAKDSAKPAGARPATARPKSQAAAPRGRLGKAVAVVAGFLGRHPWLPAAWLAGAAILAVGWTVAPSLALLWMAGWGALGGAAFGAIAALYAQRLHLRLLARHEDLLRRHEELTAAHYHLHGTVDDLRRRMDEAEKRLAAAPAGERPIRVEVRPRADALQ